MSRTVLAHLLAGQSLHRDSFEEVNPTYHKTKDVLPFKTPPRENRADPTAAPCRWTPPDYPISGLCLANRGTPTKSDTATAGSDRAKDLVDNDKSVFIFNTVVTNSSVSPTESLRAHHEY